MELTLVKYAIDTYLKYNRTDHMFHAYKTKECHQKNSIF